LTFEQRKLGSHPRAGDDEKPRRRRFAMWMLVRSRTGWPVCLVGAALLVSGSALFGAVLVATYPTPGLLSGVVVSPALEALPPGAVSVDYVNIGDEESEAGNNLAGWGPVEPATSGGVWGNEPNTRVLWEAGSDGGCRSASIDLDFGSTLGTKYLAMRWLDGISYADHFEFAVSTVPGGTVVFSGSVQDGAAGHGETWFDLGAWNVGPITGMHTVTLTATGAAWSMFSTYGQVGFSEMATFVANCCPEPPYGEDPDYDIVANPLPVVEPIGAVQVDFVDIGKTASEMGHPMTSWGPPVGQDYPGSGNWGEEDDCRVIWEPNGSTSATIDMDFGEAQGSKYIGLRWLDGLANDGTGPDDSFTMNVQGVGTTFSLTNGTANHPENWYFICVWNVGDIRGVRTITFNATGAAWSGQGTYGQVAFSQIATLSNACEAECNPNSIPAEIGISPDLVFKPRYATLVDSVDIGANDAFELAHNLVSWGPPVGQNYPGTGNWGGEDDCRVIWDTQTGSRTASIQMNFGLGTGNKYLAVRWLDGMANTGGDADDSFTIAVSNTGFVGSVTNGTANHAETWYNLCVWDVGPVQGIQTVTLTATGGQWSGWNTYGQVAFSRMTTMSGSDIPIEPSLVALPDCAAPVDFVDIGDTNSEAGHNMQSWGLPEPATNGRG
jgi:hypothetical protein